MVFWRSGISLSFSLGLVREVHGMYGYRLPNGAERTAQACTQSIYNAVVFIPHANSLLR